MPSDGEPILGSGLNRSESRRGEAPRWLAGGRKRMEDSQRNTRACHPQAAISPPTSFQSRQRGPTWTSRRPTRSGQSRPRRRFRSMRAIASPLRQLSLARLGLAYFPPLRDGNCEMRCQKCVGTIWAGCKFGGQTQQPRRERGARSVNETSTKLAPSDGDIDDMRR